MGDNNTMSANTQQWVHMEKFHLSTLLHASHIRSRVARYPVEQESREPLLEEDRGSGVQVADSLPLLLPGVPRQSRAQLLELLQGHLVPAAHGLGDDRDEGDPLLVAELSCHSHLVVECVGESRARFSSSPCSGGILERVNHCHI